MKKKENKKENDLKGIPHSYRYKIDTSQFDTPSYFKAVVLTSNGKGLGFKPLYESITKAEYDSLIENDTPFGDIIFLEK